MTRPLWSSTSSLRALADGEFARRLNRFRGGSPWYAFGVQLGAAGSLRISFRP